MVTAPFTRDPKLLQKRVLRNDVGNYGLGAHPHAVGFGYAGHSGSRNSDAILGAMIVRIRGRCRVVHPWPRRRGDRVSKCARHLEGRSLLSRPRRERDQRVPREARLARGVRVACGSELTMTLPRRPHVVQVLSVRNVSHVTSLPANSRGLPLPARGREEAALPSHSARRFVGYVRPSRGALASPAERSD